MSQYQNFSKLKELPEEVWATVLGKFSSGKTISTFVLVAYQDNTLRKSIYQICRNGLVQRYIELCTIHHKLQSKNALSYPELSDTLDIIREDIRLSNDNDDRIMSKFSEWCAILDYFEIQLDVSLSCSIVGKSHGLLASQWIVWCGQLEIPYGNIQAYLVTPDWNVCALQYWRNQEVAQLSLIHPRNDAFTFISDDQIPYGTLFGIQDSDRLRLGRQCTDLEVHVLRDTTDSRRVTLVPLNESYEECPPIVFVDHSFICRSHAMDVIPGPLLIDPKQSSLCCCWDKTNSEDLWDDALLNFGDNVIRIMNSVTNDFSKASLSDLYKNYREFTNR